MLELRSVNAGYGRARVLFDTMHFFRTGGTMEQFRALDPDLVGYCQLADSVLAPPHDNYFMDAMFAREVPGGIEVSVQLLNTTSSVTRSGEVEVSILVPGVSAPPSLAPERFTTRQGVLVRRVVPAYGELVTLRVGLAATAGGLVAIALTRGWLLLVPALALLCVGQGLASPALTSAAISRIAPDRRGAVLGVQQSAQALARVGGPALGGLAFDHIGVSAPYVVGAMSCVGCVTVLAAAGRSRRIPVPA